MGNLSLKLKEKAIIALSLTVLTHYFVLTYFKVGTTETFEGKVEKVEIIEKGLYPTAKVNFKVIKEDENGVKKTILKSINLIKNDLNFLKIGKIYKVKAHQNWLVSFR